MHISWPNKREEMETDRRVCSSPITRHDSHLHATLRLTTSHFKQLNLNINTTFSRNSRLERLRSSQPYTYVTSSASFYNNGLREVGRDGRCSSGHRQHDDIWSASLVHDHKMVNGWVIGCRFACVCGFIATEGAQTHTKQYYGNMDYAGKLGHFCHRDKWQKVAQFTLRPCKCKIHDMISHLASIHRTDAFGELECILRDKYHTPSCINATLISISTCMRLKQSQTTDRNISNVSHRVYSTRMYIPCVKPGESRCRTCYSKPKFIFFLINPVPLIVDMIQENNARTDDGIDQIYISCSQGYCLSLEL